MPSGERILKHKQTSKQTNKQTNRKTPKTSEREIEIRFFKTEITCGFGARERENHVRMHLP